MHAHMYTKYFAPSIRPRQMCFEWLIDWLIDWHTVHMMCDGHGRMHCAACGITNDEDDDRMRMGDAQVWAAGGELDTLPADSWTLLRSSRPVNDEPVNSDSNKLRSDTTLPAASGRCWCCCFLSTNNGHIKWVTEWVSSLLTTHWHKQGRPFTMSLKVNACNVVGKTSNM